MKTFEFTTLCVGKGDTEAEAWQDATDALEQDFGEPTKTVEIEDDGAPTHDFDAHTQMFKDILCTAVEGGSSYWLCGEAIRDTEGEYTGITKCFDAEDGAQKFADVDLGTIRIGMERIAENTKLCRKDIRDTVILALATPDESDLDAEAADCILQAGMFNEIIYG